MTAISFSPYSRRIASGGADGIIKVWDSVAGVGIDTLEGHTAPILDIKFSPDGKYMASAAEDKLINIWKANTLQPLMTLTGKLVSCVVFASLIHIQAIRMRPREYLSWRIVATW